MTHICRLERLESRRLFAGWVLRPDLEVDRSVSYHYDLDETGYHWGAAIGDMGEPNEWVNGRRFLAEFDPTIDGEGLYDNPDPDAHQERVRAFYEAKYNQWEPDRPVTFRLVKYDDGSFEIAGLPPPQPGSPVIPVDMGLIEGTLLPPEPDRTALATTIVPRRADPAPQIRSAAQPVFRSVADELIGGEQSLEIVSAETAQMSP
jgi:hypothetical protein